LAKKSKQKQRDRQRRTQQKRERRSRKRQGRESSRRDPEEDVPAASIAPLDPPLRNTLPPVYVDRSGAVVPDPWALLELPDGERDAEKIRAAFRRSLELHPPEAEPERARQTREARDRLLDPQRVIEREVGVLRAPDPAAWGLAAELPGQGQLDAETRLAGQAVLYALVEEELRAAGLDAHLAATRAIR
jgi:hypothetical protein